MYQVGNSQVNGSKNIERTSRGLQTDRRAKQYAPPLFSKGGDKSKFFKAYILNAGHPRKQMMPLYVYTTRDLLLMRCDQQ